MEQEFENTAWFPDAEEIPVRENDYSLPFADDLYERPVPVDYSPKRPRKSRESKKAGKGGVSVMGCIALALVFALLCSLSTAWAMDIRWRERFDNMSLALRDKNQALQSQISAMETKPGQIVVPAVSEGLLTPGQVYEQNVDAVVAIAAYSSGAMQNGQSGTYQSMGSGFILSDDGYVVSNYHVVENTETIEVITSDGSVYKAVLVGYDATNDLALLKVEAENLAFVTLGSSDQLQVGDQVAAIGNPLGELTSTLTVGYVSAKDRIVATDGSSINMLQTDAAINSGNSGGPLFNMMGEVVGITTAKYSGMSSSGVSIEGIGFAIPMDDVVDMIDDLRYLGYISGAYLGVMVMDVEAAAQNYGLPAGAYVDEVTRGYAAEAAGMLAGDIIIQLGGYEISNVTELTRMLRRFEPGQTVSVTVYRAGKEIQLRVTLDEKPRTQNPSQSQTQPYPMPDDEGFEDWYRDFMEDFYG